MIVKLPAIAKIIVLQHKVSTKYFDTLSPKMSYKYRASLFLLINRLTMLMIYFYTPLD